MQKITSPALLLDESICKSNINRMADKAQKYNLRLRPHMKTHQSKIVGRWLKDAGVEAITVSSLEMAQYFAEDGWKNITIAFPCNIGWVQEINDLAQTISLTLLINKPETAKYLEKHLAHSINAYIEIDTGSARSGLASDNISDIKDLIAVINDTKHINWIGFYTHAGHSYSCRSKEDISEVQRSVINQFDYLRKHLKPVVGDFEICSGDTPCCSMADDFGPIDTISPGNFVFYDLMQNQIGSCSYANIAVAMSCPVVDKYPKRNELIVHGGAVHFSKETLTANGVAHYGTVAHRVESHWEPVDDSSYLIKLSQEHGIIHCSKPTFKSYDIGDMITILPVHSCLTANLMKQYQLVNKNHTEIEMMK